MLFLQKNARANFNCYYLVQVCVLKHTQLGPDNSPTLDQIMTFNNVFFQSFAFKCAEIPIYSIFEHQPKFAPKRAQKR